MRILISIFLSLLLLLSPAAQRLILMSQNIAYAAPLSVASARALFSAGDIPGAAAMLDKILKPRPKVAGIQLEEAMKLYGVCAYLMGQPSKAKSAFAVVLARNPNAKLSPGDVLDPGIQTLFNQSRRSGGAAKRLPGNQGAGVRLAAKPAPEKFTGIIVKTNVARATVFDNGLFVGTSNQQISLEPGSHKILISSEGYQDVQKFFSLQKGQKLTYTINMKKPQPRVTPQMAQKSRPNVSSGGRKSGDNYGDGSDFGNAPPPKMKRKGTGSLSFENELPNQVKRTPQTSADQFFGAGAQQQPQAPQQQVQQAPIAPAPQYVAPAPQPVYQAAPQPVYQAPPPQPITIYQAPPQPQYYTQPQYAQPAPVYQQPAPQPQYAPPPQQTYQQPSPQDFQTSSANNDEPSPRPRAKMKRNKGPKKSALIAVLPGGAGQFQNGQTIKGVIFLAAEVGMAYMAYDSYSKRTIFMKQYNEYVVEAEATPANRNEQYESDAKKFQNDLSTKFTLYYVGAGAAYGVGVVDAFINMGGSRNADSDPAEDPFDASHQEPVLQQQVQKNTELKPFITANGSFGLRLKINF